MIYIEFLDILKVLAAIVIILILPFLIIGSIIAAIGLKGAIIALGIALGGILLSAIIAIAITYLLYWLITTFLANLDKRQKLYVSKRIFSWQIKIEYQ